MAQARAQTRTQTRTQTGKQAVAQATTRIHGMLTTRGRAFVATGLTLLAGGLLLGFTDITRVGVLLTALPLAAGIRARRTRIKIVASRTVHQRRIVVDQLAQVTLVLRNPSGRRAQLQLAEERFHSLLGAPPRFVLPAMEPGDVRQVTYQIRCQARGRYRLGPLTLRKQDPYGLATTTATLPGSTDILVLPRVEVLGRGRPHANGIGAEGTIRHMVALNGEDDVAVRGYRNGDDLRRIHWPTTAHRSTLMVRQEDHPARRRAVILLDSRAAGHQGNSSGNNPASNPASNPGKDPATNSFEWAVTAAASIALHLSEHRYTLHLASSEAAAGGQVRQTVDVDEAMASLAVAQLGASWDFDAVLNWAHPLASTGGLVIAIVTDHDEETLRRIAALRQPGGTGLLLLLDTASFARPGPAAPAARTLALAAMVAEAGWSTCVVTSGMTVARAWTIISARNVLMVGSGQ